MLRVQGLTKRFSGRTLLRSVSFVVNSGATAAESYPELFGDDAASARLAQLAARLAETSEGTPEGTPDEESDAALRAVEQSPPRSDVASEWAALGLRVVEPAERVAGLSGGERTKLGLLNCLASRPDLLLLDEPTNHLDLPSIAWLEARLRRFRGPVLLVSHDRALLDAVASQIVSIDARSGEAESFVGDYSAWANDQARRETERWERYRREQREQREERRQRQVISSIESQARQIENSTIHFHYRKRAKKVARKSTVPRDRLRREMDRGERTARPQKKPHGFYGEFQEGERGASRLLSLQGLGLSVGGRRLLEEVSFDVSRGERVVLMAANGSGKTSLLRAAMGALEAPCVLDGGRAYLGPSVRVGYLPQEEAPSEEGSGEETAVDLLVRSRAISATEAGNFLHQFLFDHEQLTTPVQRMSYGERRRLALARFVLEGANLLLLDEPTNHLDLPSREAFEGALSSYAGGALIVTHDRYFIEQFADRVLEVVDGGVRLVSVR